MRAFITGATGSVGRHVVPLLLDAGVEVRALTRRPATAGLPDDVEVVGGDLDRPHELESAFRDVDVLYLVMSGEQAGRVVDLAKRKGVGRIVTLSSASAGFDDNPGGAFHRDFERIVEESGLRWTHVRPGMFAGNLIDWAESIKTSRTVRAPYDQARQAPVHELDVAAVVATALLDESRAGAIYTLSGPQSLTKTEQVATIAAALGEHVHFEELTPERWREEAGAQYPPYVLDWLLAYWERALGSPEPVLPDVSDVLGRPALALDAWARDHVEDFR